MTTVRDLNPERSDDVVALQQLLESAPDYSLRVSGVAPTGSAGRDALTVRPEGFPREQKFGIGVWSDDGRQLLGFADVLRGWPEAQTAHIGLLLVHGDSRGIGIGRAVHDAVVHRASEWGGIELLRLNTVESNATAAAPFWRALGYRSTGATAEYRSGSVTSSTMVWERALLS